jgi:hypothetical protein
MPAPSPALGFAGATSPALNDARERARACLLIPLVFETRFLPRAPFARACLLIPLVFETQFLRQASSHTLSCWSLLSSVPPAFTGSLLPRCETSNRHKDPFSQ